jgi:hypothetical protein
VQLGVNERAVFFEPLEGVAGVAVLLVVAIGGAAIAEEDHDLVDRFGVLAKVVLDTRQKADLCLNP